jgi:hypothetical protein
MFSKSFLHILFDEYLLNIDNKLGYNFDRPITYILALIASIRLFLIILIFISRKNKIDMLTYILIYLMITAYLKIYHGYLELSNEKDSEIYKLFDKYQDIDSVIIFLISTYILGYIFLK